MLTPHATGERIAAAAWAALWGEFDTVDRAGLCLRFARRVVEHGLGWSGGELYRRYLVARTQSDAATGRTDWTPWAADLEASLRSLGLGVPWAERQPGDLVFSHRQATPFGHVGVLLERDMVAESIRAEARPRGGAFGPFRVLSRLGDWGGVTLVARVGEELDG